MITLKKRLSLPPRAITRVQLIESATRLRQMQQPMLIIEHGTARIEELEKELAKARAERDAARNAAVERAHREERVKAKTIRVVDNRAAWQAKQPKARLPMVAMHSTRVITADVWQQPTEHEA